MILVKCDTQKNLILLGACIDVFIYITQVFEIVKQLTFIIFSFLDIICTCINMKVCIFVCITCILSAYQLAENDFYHC